MLLNFESSDSPLAFGKPWICQCDDIYDYMIMAYDVNESEMESSESGSDNA